MMEAFPSILQIKRQKILVLDEDSVWRWRRITESGMPQRNLKTKKRKQKSFLRPLDKTRFKGTNTINNDPPGPPPLRGHNKFSFGHLFWLLLARAWNFTEECGVQTYSIIAVFTERNHAFIYSIGGFGLWILGLAATSEHKCIIVIKPRSHLITKDDNVSMALSSKNWMIFWKRQLPLLTALLKTHENHP